jgi:hypothetical protein
MRCHFGLPQLPLASLVRHEAARAAPATMLAGPLEPFNAPNEWLVYGHLHLILALPTLTLLSVSPPLQNAQPLTKKAAYGFISFIGKEHPLPTTPYSLPLCSTTCKIVISA